MPIAGNVRVLFGKDSQKMSDFGICLAIDFECSSKSHAVRTAGAVLGSPDLQSPKPYATCANFRGYWMARIDVIKTKRHLTFPLLRFERPGIHTPPLLIFATRRMPSGIHQCEASYPESTT